MNEIRTIIEELLRKIFGLPKPAPAKVYSD